MQFDKDAGIAKILIRNDPTHHAGMGIILDNRHVMTCAHVVNVALGRAAETLEEPDPTELATVVFPLVHHSKPVQGTVVAWKSEQDIAVLKLREDAPADAGTATFAHVHGPTSDDRLIVFGIEAGRQTGNYVETKFMGPTSPPLIEIDGVNTVHIFIKGGFSGAAVWDTGHEATVGMVRSIRVGNQIKVAYMVPTEALRAAWPALPAEDRRLPQSFHWIWSAVASACFLAMFYLFVVERGPAPDQHPQLAAFAGMHVYALLAPVTAWLWWLYAKDFKLHDWSTRIPRFGGIRTAMGSSAEKVLWMISVVILILAPIYMQGHFLIVFNNQGFVYMYPDRFGYTKEELEGGNNCPSRSVPLCKHPEAGRYSLVTAKPPSAGAYWDNAYQYGDYENHPETVRRSVTFWPILQPALVMLLTALAVFLNGVVLFQSFFSSGNTGRRSRHSSKTSGGPGPALATSAQ